MLQKLNYIHNNPVKAGLVDNMENWKWSSAVDYLRDEFEDSFIFKDWK